MTDVHGMHRTNDHDTSVEAAEQIVGKLRELQQTVLDALISAGPNGLTDWELEECCGSHGSTYRSRRAELVEMGLVVKTTGRRVINGSNRIVWVAAEFTKVEEQAA